MIEFDDDYENGIDEDCDFIIKRKQVREGQSILVAN